jgi:hypothetical protein
MGILEYIKIPERFTIAAMKVELSQADIDPSQTSLVEEFRNHRYIPYTLPHSPNKIDNRTMVFLSAPTFT